MCVLLFREKREESTGRVKENSGSILYTITRLNKSVSCPKMGFQSQILVPQQRSVLANDNDVVFQAFRSDIRRNPHANLHGHRIKTCMVTASYLDVHPDARESVCVCVCVNIHLHMMDNPKVFSASHDEHN